MVDEARERAQQRLDQLKGFYSHLGFFILVNVLLIVVDLLTSPGVWWFYWVTIFWSIALVTHAAHVFGERQVFSMEWEEKKIQQYMEEERQVK